MEIERLRQKTFDIHILDVFGSHIQALTVQYPRRSALGHRLAWSLGSESFRGKHNASIQYR